MSRTFNTRFSSRKTPAKSHADVVKTSILDLRKINPNLTDQEYASWYSNKFKIPREAVLSVLNRSKEGLR